MTVHSAAADRPGWRSRLRERGDKALAAFAWISALTLLIGASAGF
jgi:hypothetical protein